MFSSAFQALQVFFKIRKKHESFKSCVSQDHHVLLHCMQNFKLVQKKELRSLANQIYL